jgi:hypothetical protein
LPGSGQRHLSGTSTSFNLPKSIDSSTLGINKLASLPILLAIKQDIDAGKTWITTKNPFETSRQITSKCCLSIWHCPMTSMVHKRKDKQFYSKTGSNIPGEGALVDQIISAQPGQIPQMAGFLTSKEI